METTGLWEVHMELVHAIGNVWDIWLATTFAVIVAFHLGGEAINRMLVWVGSALYLSVSLVGIARYLMYLTQMGGVREEGIAAGLAPFPTSVGLGSFVAILTLATMVAGTAATIAFAFYRFRQSAN